jgi:hypothetical protein
MLRSAAVQVFAKRFWGFDPVRWPIISFGLEANRDALIQASMPGDLIAFIGTQSEPTAPEERGRFLGLAEIGRLPIDSLDVLDPANIRPVDYDANRRFKWPKAMPMLRAWRFLAKPRVTEVLREQLTFEATVRAVRLDKIDQGRHPYATQRRDCSSRGRDCPPSSRSCGCTFCDRADARARPIFLVWEYIKGC